MSENVQKNHRVNEDQEELNAFYQDIQRLTDETNPIFEEETTDAVEKSRKLMDETMDFCLASRYCTPLLDTTLLPERKEQLVNLAATIYMQAWIKGDSQARQNIHSFAAEKYVPKNSRKKRGEIDVDERLAREAWRYLKDQRKRQEMHVAQQTYDKKIFDEDKPPKKEKLSYAQAVDFFELWKTDGRLTGRTDILELYRGRKKLFGTKPRISTLEGAYRNYYRIFESITPGTDAEKTMNDIEYTVTSMMAHEMEYTDHFHLAAMISIYLIKNECELDLNENAESIRLLWARADSVKGEAISGKKRMFAYYPYDIFHYDEDIQYLLNQDQQSGSYLQKRRDDMIILRNTIFLAALAQNTSALPHWRERDYLAARNFFQNRLPVYAVYSNSQLCKEAGKQGYRMYEKDFHFILSFYEFWLNMKIEGSCRDNKADREDYIKGMKYFRKYFKS